MKRTLKWIGIGLVSLLVLVLVWGFLIEPRLIDTEEYTAAVPRLPSAWEGKRVAVIADYQIGMWGANTGTMQRMSERLVEERPAVVLLAGDFLYKAGPDPTDEIQKAIEVVRPLTAAGLPTFAVLGNHDYSIDVKEDPVDEQQAARLAAALRAVGVRVLENEAVALSGAPGGAQADSALYLVGIGSEWAGHANPAAALGQVPATAPRIVFMHNPTSFPKIAAGAAHLAVAGHTHGGQIIIPGLPSWSWISIVADREIHADGWIQASYGQPGNRLYVNRGVGFSDLPLRINAPPEITFFRLIHGPASPR